MRLSEKQLALLALLKDGSNVIHGISPGKDSGGYFLEAKGDHRNLDGRTVSALIDRGLLKCWGSAGQFSTGYSITDAGKSALSSQGRDTP